MTVELVREVLASIPDRRPDALMVGAAILLFTHRKRTITFCAQHRIPAIYAYREAVIDGGLISYAASLTGTFRNAGSYVARILSGPSPRTCPNSQRGSS